MRISEIVAESSLSETPLPSDWDASQYSPGSTFKTRLAYALERAKRIGAGSSRVAMTIEYNGRPTVLKVAKNAKGLAQNDAEAQILSDGYARQLGIMIPIIDYDEQNAQPTWVHTELAQRTTEKQLCQLLHTDSLHTLIYYALTLVGKNKLYSLQRLEQRLRDNGITDEQLETFQDYANSLGELAMSFNVELADFVRAANWGIYNGAPVVIDVGFTSDVMGQYYRR